MNVGLGTRLRRLIDLLDGDVQSVYDQMDVAFRPRFYPVVQALLTSNALSINGISEAIHVSQPAATQTVNEMKKLGLVEAVTGMDKRQRLIRLSGKGRELSRRLDPIWEATHRAAGGLDRELPAALMETINGALEALERRPFRERIHAEMSK